MEQNKRPEITQGHVDAQHVTKVTFQVPEGGWLSDKGRGDSEMPTPRPHAAVESNE